MGFPNRNFVVAVAVVVLLPTLGQQSPLSSGSISVGFSSNLRLPLSNHLVARAGPTCYYPDSQIASDFNYTTCDSRSSTGYGNPEGYGGCCFQGEGDVCLGNGLCYWPPQPDGHGNYIYRAGCTDKSWTDDVCTKVCISDVPNHFETVSFCSNTTDFCCAKSSKGDCCTHSELRFNLTLPGSVWQNLVNGTNVTVTPSIAPGGSRGDSTSTSTETTGTGGTLVAGTDPAHTTTAASGGGLSVGAGIGIGVGAAVVALGGMFGAYLLWRKRRRNTGVENPQEKVEPNSIAPSSRTGIELASEMSRPGSPVVHRESVVSPLQSRVNSGLPGLDLQRSYSSSFTWNNSFGGGSFGGIRPPAEAYGTPRYELHEDVKRFPGSI